MIKDFFNYYLEHTLCILGFTVIMILIQLFIRRYWKNKILEIASKIKEQQDNDYEEVTL